MRHKRFDSHTTILVHELDADTLFNLENPIDSITIKVSEFSKKLTEYGIEHDIDMKHAPNYANHSNMYAWVLYCNKEDMAFIKMSSLL